MAFTIFYAWQSDRPEKSNRYFIRDALKVAIKKIKADVDIDDAPELDHDTKGVPGTPKIAETITEKIASCGIFLADLTFVGRSEPEAGNKSKLMPNSNVMIELGQAAMSVGWERILCAMNTAYGEAENLPFDLKHRSFPTQFDLKMPGETNLKAGIKKTLASELERRIRLVMVAGIPDAPEARIKVLRCEWMLVNDRNPSSNRNGLFLSLLNSGPDIYDLKAAIEVDCAVASPETIHHPRHLQQLAPGYHGRISYQFGPDNRQFPNPWKPGMAVDLYMPQQRTATLPGFCGGNKFKDLLPDKVSIAVYGSGDRLLKRIPGREFMQHLMSW